MVPTFGDHHSVHRIYQLLHFFSILRVRPLCYNITVMSFRNDAIFWVEVHKISPNPYQPRREFDEARLKELAESIRQYGVLQPLVVTRKEVSKSDGGIAVEYELIAGERRLRASRLAGVEQVPVIIRDGAESDLMKLELAIIENLQREDLNSVDRAQAFRQLADQFHLSHSQVAQKVGRSREYVTNTLRLLLLPEEILSAVSRGALSEGHARTLLILSDKPEEQNVIFREIMLKKLSVREVERITRKLATDKVRRKDNIDLELIEVEKQLTEALGTRVQIAKTDFGGKVTIDYFSTEDLNKILDMMGQGSVSHRSVTDKTSVAPVEGVEAVIATEVQNTELSEENAGEVPLDDRSGEDKKEDDDTDLYSIRNFSL